MEGFWASLRAKKACNKTVHSTTLFYYYHFTLPVSQETSGRLKSPTTTVSNLLDVLQISFILDSNILFIGAVKLGDQYMQAIQNCPILLSSSIANESGARSEKSLTILC